MAEYVEQLLRAWFAKQEGYFGTCAGVVHADGSETQVGDPLFDGAVDVRDLAIRISELVCGLVGQPPCDWVMEYDPTASREL